jgi:hypothetical protein
VSNRFGGEEELLKVWEDNPEMLSDDEREHAAAINSRRHRGRGFEVTILCDEMSPKTLRQLLRRVANEIGDQEFQKGTAAGVFWDEEFTVEVARVKANSRRRS